MSESKTRPSDDKKIQLIMSVLKTPKTIDFLANLINASPVETRRIIAKIRKHHPIFAYKDGSGYKYASKEEAKHLISFEKNLIKNHMKNLQILKNYVGG